MTLNTRSRLETHIEEKACEHADSIGYIHVKLDKAKRGWPDRMFLGPYSDVLFVEFKRPGESPNPKQEALHRKFNELGHYVHVVDSLDQFKAIFP